jgi:hypothetical protein
LAADPTGMAARLDTQEDPRRRDRHIRRLDQQPGGTSSARSFPNWRRSCREPLPCESGGLASSMLGTIRISGIRWKRLDEGI